VIFCLVFETLHFCHQGQFFFNEEEVQRHIASHPLDFCHLQRKAAQSPVRVF